MYRESSKKTSLPVTGNAQKLMKSLGETLGVKREVSMSNKFHQKLISKNASGIHFKDRGDMDFAESASSRASHGRNNFNKYLITASDRYEYRPITDTAQQTARETLSKLNQCHAEAKARQEQYLTKSQQSVKSRPIPKAKPPQINHLFSDDIVTYMGLTSASKILKKNELLNKPEEKKNRCEHRHRHSNSNHHHKQNRQQQQEQRHLKELLEPQEEDPSPNEQMQTQQQQQQTPQRKSEKNNREKVAETKDDDTEEFFSLLRTTVEKSVTETMDSVLKKTFAEFDKRLEQHTKKIMNLNQKLNNSLCGKITHYGEENSRHFRYLCMKSEYDKMFYQHHNEMAKKSVSPPPPTPATETAAKKSKNASPKGCSLPSTQTLVPDQSPRAHSMGTKKCIDQSLRNMVTELKRFLLEYESSVTVDEDATTKSSTTSVSSDLCVENDYKNRMCLFQAEDEEESNLSSDSVDDAISSRMARKRNEAATENLNSLNDSSNGGGDA